MLLVELVIPEHNREFLGKWTDLEMLLGAVAVVVDEDGTT